MAGLDVRHYLTRGGVAPFGRWLAKLADRQARARVIVRIDRVAATGRFGDCRAVGDGVYELRIDWGAGYRVYYALTGSAVLLLLVGGDKRTQDADIRAARKYWKDWLERNRA